jgi:chemotaxis protein MotA
MDFTTIVGLLAGFSMIFWAMCHGSDWRTFMSSHAAIIVFGGCTSAICVCFPPKKIANIMKIIGKTFMYKIGDPAVEVERLAEFAALARKEGLLALEERLTTVTDPFLLKALRLVVDGYPPETVRKILEADVAAMQERHHSGKVLLEKMGEFGPAFGMVGTLIGLIQMLQNLSDPSQIGAGMSTALLATLYGAVLTNLMMLPMACKLDQRKKEETLLRGMIIEGVTAIQAGDKPQIVKERLRAFMDPRARAKMEAAQAHAPA